MRTAILTKPSTNMNRQYGGLISRTDHRLPIAPCRFCNKDHSNDSCTKYKSADARKQVIKYSCYICLKFGHRAFECRIFKSCYYCRQKHHHHRSLCQKKFGAFENDNITYSPKHLAIWQLSLGCLLMRTIASFLRYTGYLNFINGPISCVLLLILVHVQLLSCLFF